MTETRQPSPPVQAGDLLRLPVQPPVGSRVRVNGGRYGGLTFQHLYTDTWIVQHPHRAPDEDWPTLLCSARSAGVTLTRIGPGG